jgi:hypothetical protein
MKKGYLNSLFLGAALGLSLVAVSPLTLAAEAAKSPTVETSPIVEVEKSPITPIPELVKEKLDYRLVYAEKSPVKTIPLNNTEFKVRVYSNGTPKGDQELKTNEEAEFDFDKLAKSHSTFISMSLVKIQDDAKNNQICQGNLVPGKNELVVTCQKKN